MAASLARSQLSRMIERANAIDRTSYLLVRGRAFYLGEQTFAMVFRRMPQPTATQHLDAVRRVIEAATVEVAVPEPRRSGKPTRRGTAKQAVSVTVSVGVAESEGDGADPHKVLRAAEHALDRVQQAAPQAVSA